MPPTWRAPRERGAVRELADRGRGIYLARTRADGASSFDYVSPQAGRILGIDAAAASVYAAIGFGAFDPDDLPSLIARAAQMYADRAPFLWEGRVIVAGETRFIRVRADASESTPT